MGRAPAPLDGGVPYGIALAAAALLIYPDTPGCSSADERGFARLVSRHSVDRMARARARASAMFSAQHIFNSHLDTPR